jgi:hypothetical protein
LLLSRGCVDGRVAAGVVFSVPFKPLCVKSVRIDRSPLVSVVIECRVNNDAIR